MKTLKYMFHRIDTFYHGVNLNKSYGFEVWHSVTGQRLNQAIGHFETQEVAEYEARRLIDNYEETL